MDQLSTWLGRVQSGFHTPTLLQVDRGWDGWGGGGEGGVGGVRLVKNQKLSEFKAELPSLIRGRTGTDATSKSEI